MPDPALAHPALYRKGAAEAAKIARERAAEIASLTFELPGDDESFHRAVHEELQRTCALLDEDVADVMVSAGVGKYAAKFPEWSAAARADGVFPCGTVVERIVADAEAQKRAKDLLAIKKEEDRVREARPIAQRPADLNVFAVRSDNDDDPLLRMAPCVGKIYLVPRGRLDFWRNPEIDLGHRRTLLAHDVTLEAVPDFWRRALKLATQVTEMTEAIEMVAYRGQIDRTRQPRGLDLRTEEGRAAREAFRKILRKRMSRVYGVAPDLNAVRVIAALAIFGLELDRRVALSTFREEWKSHWLQITSEPPNWRAELNGVRVWGHAADGKEFSTPATNLYKTWEQYRDAVKPMASDAFAPAVFAGAAPGVIGVGDLKHLVEAPAAELVKTREPAPEPTADPWTSAIATAIAQRPWVEKNEIVSALQALGLLPMDPSRAEWRRFHACLKTLGFTEGKKRGEDGRLFRILRSVFAAG